MKIATLHHRNRRVGLLSLLFAALMLVLGYASVPLYRMFCEATGFGGATRRISEAEARAIVPVDRTISIRFDANVDNTIPWKFLPEHATDTVSIGARDMAVFIARNLSSEPVTGQASFNVEPEQAGKYFNKIQCFCFTEQTLRPGQEVRMPVIYKIDPAILQDENARDVEQITLSYTFHRVKQPSS